jgi:hypothetical protein
MDLNPAIRPVGGSSAADTQMMLMSKNHMISNI